MDINAILTQIFKNAHPDMSDDEVQKQIAGASDNTKNEIGTKLGLNDSAMNLTPPTDVNSVPSPMDVKVSDNTVTQNGNLPSMQAPAPSPALPPLPPASNVPDTNDSAANTPPPVTQNKPAPANTAAPVPPVSPPASPAVPASNDNDARNAMLAKATQNRKNMTLPIALSGAGDAIATGLRARGLNVPNDKQNELVALAKQNFDESKGLFEDKLQNDPTSDVSKAYRDMVTQIAPNMATDPNFQNMSAKSIGDKLPLIDTMMKAKASEDSRKSALAQTQATRDLNVGLRQDQQQDKLEQNAKQMVANLRGDKSLARTEEQRDGAIVAYNRLKEIQASGQTPNPVDYADILGQIYKARTGTAPGEQIMNDIRQSTAKGSLDKAYTYITGQQSPATTQDITNSLTNMAKSMGQQADKLHAGYMNSHLIKPAGLDDDRWQPIATTGRGTSFADATKQNAQSTSQSDPMGLR